MLERENKSSVNCVLTLKIKENDYKPMVENALVSYKKNANIPGFRKGLVPISMIKAKYEKIIKIEEINKLIQKNLYDYIIKEKLNLLGSPIQLDEVIDWEAKDINFKFEVGLSPQIEVDLKNIKLDTSYFKIKIEDKEIEEQIQKYQEQLGEKKDKDFVEKEDVVYGLVDIDGETKNYSFKIADLKNKVNVENLLNKKKGDSVTLIIKDLYKKAEDLEVFLGKKENNNKDFLFTIENIFKIEPHVINQDFFDKLFGKDKVKNEQEMKDKLKEDSLKTLQEDADKYFLFEIIDSIINQVKFDIPDEFLKRWIMLNNKDITVDKIDEVYLKEQKVLRRQIIESEILKSNNIEIKEDDIKEKIREVLNIQMAMYGTELPEERINDIVENIIKNNHQEVERVRGLIVTDKLFGIIKENLKYKEKEVSFKDYVEEVTKKNKK